jgi:hypothetical protein
VCSSTPFRISASRLRLRRVSSSSATGAALTARRFFPATSSAILCCRSAGVSVHKEEADLSRVDDESLRENWRGSDLCSLVGSNAIIRSSQHEYVTVNGGKSVHDIKSDELGGTSIHSSRWSFLGFAASLKIKGRISLT